MKVWKICTWVLLVITIMGAALDLGVAAGIVSIEVISEPPASRIWAGCSAVAGLLLAWVLWRALGLLRYINEGRHIIPLP